MYKIPGIVSKIQLNKKDLSSEEVVLVGTKLWTYRNFHALKTSISAEKNTYKYIHEPYYTYDGNDDEQTAKLRQQYKHVVDSNALLMDDSDSDNESESIDRTIELDQLL